MTLPRFNDTWMRRGWRIGFPNRARHFASNLELDSCGSHGSHPPHIHKTNRYCQGRRFDST